MSRPEDHLYEFAAFRLDAAERLLLRDGRPVPLTPKVFDTLLALVERSGHLVEKDELINKLWPDTFVEEATLARNISDLRKALGEAHKYIETVPKRGYRFVASVMELGNDGAELVLEEHTRSHVVIEEEKEQAQDQHSQRAAAISQAFESSVRAWIIKPLILASTLLVVAATLYFLRQSGDMRRKPENLV